MPSSIGSASSLLDHFLNSHW